MEPPPAQAPKGPAPSGPAPSHKYACSLCARRKVKCDKDDPCSNCLKARAECLYEAPAPPRPRMRAADADLVARLVLYEDLMRRHRIDFTGLTNFWASPGLEAEGGDKKNLDTPIPWKSATTLPPSAALPESTATHAPLERCLWSDLEPELQNPPAKLLRCRGDPALHPTPPLQDILTGDQPELSQLHPNASHISRLWQTYVERVDPLIKFTHVPTLQERILNASWEGPANAHKPLVATLFAVYTLAVTSMSSAQCEASFGEPRSTLMMRYRVAAVRVLVAADVFTTRDFEVLQALLLFLFSEPESALTLSLLSVAVKMGEVIGLQRASSDPKLSFFDREMRIRLWWQLRGLEHRANMAFTSSPSKSPTESGDLRLPLNVNDVDLHPDMVEPPVEHSGPTEMICALMRFQVIKWVRSSSAGAVLFERIRRGPVPGRAPLDAEDEAIGALEEIYEEKLFRRSDAHIPLHGLVRSIARGAIASLRFRLHHPRGRASVRSGEVHMSRDELDMLFDSAVACLEATMACSQTKFSRHLVSLIRPPLGMDPYIYMISDLRQRCSGVRADLAWSLVEHLYSEHPELINDTATPLFAALGELTLEAWDARSRALKRELRKLGPTPLFIQLLRDVNEFKNQDRPQLPIAMDPCSSDELGSLDMHDLDWNYWNGFLQP